MGRASTMWIAVILLAAAMLACNGATVTTKSASSSPTASAPKQVAALTATPTRVSTATPAPAKSSPTPSKQPALASSPTPAPQAGTAPTTAKFVLKIAKVSHPGALAMDGQGNVYVATTNSVDKYDPSGKRLAQWSSGHFGGSGDYFSPRGVALDVQGNIYLTDVGNHQIVKLDPNGKGLARWGGEGSDDGQFDDPYAVAVDQQGNIYVADLMKDRIQKFDPNGKFMLKWGSHGGGDGQFSALAGIAVDPQGNVWVSDGVSLQRFDANGKFLLRLEGKDVGQPQGVTTDANGNIYFTEWYDKQVVELDPNGSLIGKWGEKGDGDGQFQGPIGVAVNAQGKVWVSDEQAGTLQLFQQE